MTKQPKQDDEECPRCTHLEIVLNRELDLTERILTMFRDTAFPDVAAVHEKAAEILKHAQEHRAVVAPKRTGPRRKDPLEGFTVRGIPVDRLILEQRLTPKDITEERIAGLLSISTREFQRRIERLSKVNGLTWHVLQRLWQNLAASNQPD